MLKLSPQKSRLSGVLIISFFILAAFIISGFTISTFDPAINRKLPPSQGSGQVDVIKNGSFEQRDSNTKNGVALDWKPYSNGQAWFGWYDETWPEAIRTGQHAQLLEVYQVEANILDRVIAIHQTVDVVSNASYNLTIHSIMRSQAPAQDRNKNEFELHWGVDTSGEGNYDNVQVWNRMPLTEQFRLGSTGKYPEDVRLFYETITSTIQTTGTNRITLFIRGLKKFPTGTEINFDVDDVSLIGPQPSAVQPTSTPTSTAATANATPPAAIPATGTVQTRNVSGGVLAMGGLVLIMLGASATVRLLIRKEKP